MTEVQPASHDHLVVIGSSAGGIEALGSLLGSLRPDFPAPVVLAQHLDPARPSNLGTILERKTKLPIVVVGESTRLEGGRVYVVPSNRHVVIKDGHVDLEADHDKRPRPSVDRLLSTAATSYGERLVAVILTGSGSDGAAGAVDVKDAGGIVIIQNPETARYPSMPLALPPTAVDHVLDLERIGPMLQDLVSGVALPRGEQPTDDALRDILAIVSRSASIDFRPYKPASILRRIGRRMAVTHTHGIREYAQYLESHPEEIAELVMALLIKVTEFFRDPEAFELLKTEILPDLIARGRERGRVLRLWSAGCATGEEAYSLAILAADLIGSELPEWSVKIFATDLDERAIEFARRGLYPSNLLRELPQAYTGRYFENADQGLRIVKSLRQMVIFGQQDLSRGVPFPRIDLVVCRNLLIYFQPQLQQEVLDLFAYSLQQSNGYLLLGKAETARPSKSSFELVNKRWKVYRCLAGPLSPVVTQQSAPPVSTRAASSPRAGRHERPAPEPEVAGFEAEIGGLRRFNETFLRYLPTGIAVIDRAYRILSINGAARRLLSIRDLANDQDFLHTARGLPYSDVRGAIDSVFRDRNGVSLHELYVDGAPGGEGRYVGVTITLVQLEPGAPEHALISVVDATEGVQTRRRLEAMQSEQQLLVDELGTTNKRLSEVNKELQDSNEELQAANEELMLAQEELQATNEEFEATNEELQATNEELETNNEELQATNEELETTNEELQARSTELQEMTRILSSEQKRLSEMVELSPTAMLVMRGPALMVDAFNARFRPLFTEEHATGRSLDDVLTTAAAEIPQRVREAMRANEIVTLDSIQLPFLVRGERDFREYVFTIVPSHGPNGEVTGAVLYAEDATRRNAWGKAERGARLRLLVERADQVTLALFDPRSGELLQASPRYVAAAGRAPQPSREALKEVAAAGVPQRVPAARVPASDGRGESVWDYTLIPIAEAEGDHGAHYVVLSAREVKDPGAAG